MNYSFKNKVALITGAAQGIGKAFAEHLLAEHVQVMLIDINGNLGALTRKELAEKYGDNNVKFIECDITNDAQFEDAFKETIKIFGKIDLLINNAGIVCEEDPGWRKAIQVNFMAVVKGTYLGLKYMAKNEGKNGGTIVNIASTCSFKSYAIVPVYSATKSAVNQFSRSIGSKFHYDRTAVRVITLNPGVTDTQIFVSNPHFKVTHENCEEKDELRKAFRQSVTNMGKGLIQVLKTAESGSIWVIDEEKPAQRISFNVEIHDN